MQQMRGRGNPVLLLDAGDCFFSSPTKKPPTKAEELQELRKGRTVLNAYNLLGYQALGLGPADLQLGIATLVAFEKEARFPFLCANLVEKGTRKPVFKASTVIEAGGIRFGVYGVMMHQLNETYRNRVVPDAELLDAEQVTRELVPELRKSCDVVIALSQLNVDQNERLLDANPGIDVLIDPLSRNGTKAIWIAENEYYTERNGFPILRIDGQGSRVGVFEMYFAPGSRRLKEHEALDAALEPHFMRHPEMAQVVEEFEKGRTKPLVVDFDTLKPRLSDELLGEEGCGSCHQDQARFWKGTKHADTYSTLEKTGDHFRMDCVVCHALGYGVAFADLKAVGRFKEVQCEACHGVKPGHADEPKKVVFGPVLEDTCWGCHNPQITKKDFRYEDSKDRASCPKIQR
ncbi:MAG: hypothetical protein HY721_33815 [Planctomycetes bacterium]|nr:hypothetical protein [Planctomycetota bacterium]